MSKSDCSRHTNNVAGIADMKVLAEAIGDLRYDVLSELLWQLQTKLHNDSMKDMDQKKFKLAHALSRASHRMYEASVCIESAWMISKPFMDQSEKDGQ